MTNEEPNGQGLSGVYNILTTPFTPDHAVDEVSLHRLVEANLAMGVDGITVLGVAGEAHKLTAEERERITAIVLEVVAGKVPIFVGTSHDDTDTTIAASRSAESAGAAGVMIAPPTGLQPGPSLTEHFRQIAETIGVPIILQDYPPATQVIMTPMDMAALIEAVPKITTIKLEGTPTPLRTGQTLKLLSNATSVVGALGGMYFLDELRRGASGTMTGFAYPEILIQIWRSWASGNRKRATELYHRYLPILVFEGQPGIGLAIRKEILRRRGLIDSAILRPPDLQLDEAIASDLSEVMTALALEATFDRRETNAAGLD
jgi:4-hydroxy-tetrahydrodipicolinate synthase